MKDLPRNHLTKIKAPHTLRRVIARIRKARRKPKIVFTNGCFDLLHKGHVIYLQQARRLGSHLIVALNGDASVTRLKGPTRPINSLADRLEVIAALESVDFVTWFDEETPLETIQIIQPDVLVKGGDWKSEQIVGADWVMGQGGKVRSLSFVEGKSTTRMIERARNS